MGPTWVLSAPGGPLVGPMNLAIRVAIHTMQYHFRYGLFSKIQHTSLNSSVRAWCRCLLWVAAFSIILCWTILWHIRIAPVTVYVDILQNCDQLIPLTKGQKCGKQFHIITISCCSAVLISITGFKCHVYILILHILFSTIDILRSPPHTVCTDDLLTH